MKPAFIRRAVGIRSSCQSILGLSKSSARSGSPHTSWTFPSSFRHQNRISPGIPSKYRTLRPRVVPRGIGSDSVILEQTVEGIHGHRLSCGKKHSLVQCANTADHDGTLIDTLCFGSHARTNTRCGTKATHLRSRFVENALPHMRWRVFKRRERRKSTTAKIMCQFSQLWNLSLAP